MLLIGSRAMPRHLLSREPLDWDWVCTWEEFEEWQSDVPHSTIQACYPTNGGNTMVVRAAGIINEYEIAWPGSSAAALLRVVPNGKADLDLLFTLKSTHRFKKDSPHFEKTRRDYMALRGAGAIVGGGDGRYGDFYKHRMAEYAHQHPKLNVAKSDFFVPGGALQYTYDHDDIHKVVARGGRPAYLSFQRPGSQVMCDRGLFEAAPFEVQLSAVIEEATVLALERSQIPFPGKWTPDRSYRVALQKVASSITSGWFREFAWEQYDKAMEQRPGAYVQQFWEAVEAGKVRKHAA